MRREKLEAVRGQRPEGYVEAVLAVATRRGDMLYLSPKDWVLIADRYGVPVQVPYPQLAQMLKSAAGAATRTAAAAAQGERVRCTPEEELERERVCRPCIAFDPEALRCRLCGCFLRSQLVSKWSLVNETCDLDKWPQLTPTQL